jgi:predicted chitinase
MDAAFFNAVRASLYAGALNQSQVDSLEAIGQAWEQYGDGDPRKLAYALATAHHETGGFRYVREIWGPTVQQKRYESRKDLGNTLKGDGKRFMGRGFVQLTGRRNYADWSKRTGLDLLKEPDLVTQPAVAARILVQGSMLGTFTGKKLGDYIDGSKADYVQARRVINGTDRAVLIAGYAEKFLAALQGAPKAAPTPKPRPIPTQPLPEPASKSPLAVAGGFIIAIIVAGYALLKANGVPLP